MIFQLRVSCGSGRGEEGEGRETYEILVHQLVEIVEFGFWVPETGLDCLAVGFQGAGDGGEVDNAGVL